MDFELWEAIAHIYKLQGREIFYVVQQNESIHYKAQESKVDQLNSVENKL